MAEHPIQGLMKTAMESIKGMVDVNTIVGDAVETPDGTVIVPISRVAFGFAAGGGDYETDDLDGQHTNNLPFGGGSGAGVSVKPVGFLVCSPTNGVRFMSVESNLLYDRIIDMVPQVMNKLQALFEHNHESYESHESHENNLNQNDKLDQLAHTTQTQ
ncbi:MAG TPA: GerW family sporulation protein [Methylomusa anaerophila]|uniref:Putative spore protein YtfJ n=1 Tax=Methylomusa anaerophila TaxID=1930071 RepID=A0A348APG0_9FIRM|nr:GerW family sporulation protein [Methylomusa anaerophila]BBB92958.1 putative spore protein YtfJ [Methylomusa anaerophila]HML87208.1 GerW family sporulation protein [Methylomusa anaerophila]